MRTTIGQVLVNNALPPELRDYSRVLSKGEVDSILEEIANKYPDTYKDVSWKLMQLGRKAAFEEGVTLRLRDLLPAIDKRDFLAQIDQKSKQIDSVKDATPEEKQEAKEELFATIHSAMKNMTYDAALKSDNPLALQVKSKARGNQDQLNSILTSPGTYQDSQGRTIPVFIRRSYAEGLDPHEYYAASYGARLGVISTKSGTRQAGYLGKLMSTASMDSVVTEDDCGTPYGLPVRADDPDNIGAVLARDIGKLKAGTVITKEVMAELQRSKADQIVVRSPTTCGTHKGLCKQCVGIRETGDFPTIGYNIGLNAASALAEQLAQQSLNTKHSGKKSSKSTSYAGFDVVRNLATVPSTFPNSATVSEHDGTVDRIVEAPQGGYHIYVDGQEHYVPAGEMLNVKEGDEVEAGDSLSQGVINPSDIVRLKGVGEGRKYFTDAMTRAFRETNYGVNRRNVEVLSRSLINHVDIEDEDAAGQYLPGDTVTYQSWAYGYKPRKDAVTVTPKKAIGQYMESPALNYTIGTRITKRVADQLNKFGVSDVLAHPKPVGVTPHMISVVNTPEYTDDWVARLGSSYLKTRLLEDVHRGATSQEHSVHPYPSLAKGVEFGQQKGKEFTY